MSELSLGPSRSENQRILRGIILEVGAKYNVGIRSITGRSRQAHVVAVRYEAIHAVAKAVGWKPNCGNWSRHYWNSMTIGKLFNRDHTTILYALGRVKRGCGGE